MRPTLVVLSIVLVSVSACGQSVPTCESDCTTVHPPACASTCTSDQATATADGRGADFQLLLTCIGNAGSFASECAPLACGLTDAFGTPTGCASAAARSTQADAGASADPSCTDVGGMCIPTTETYSCTRVSGVCDMWFVCCEE